MSFSISSTDISLEDDHILRATVWNMAGKKMESSIDLDLYIGNKDGKYCVYCLALPPLAIDYSEAHTKCKTGYFKWGGKNYSLTGRNLRLENAILIGDLIKLDDGVREDQRIDLDDHIENVDGVLKFKS